MNHLNRKNIPNALSQALTLTLPTRNAVLQRAPSVQQFWHKHATLLEAAWHQWQNTEHAPTFKPSSDLIDQRLRTAVEQASQDPTQESFVKDLCQEVAPGVFKVQFFNSERLAELRTYLDTLANAGIATRAPFGIAYNRRGAMLDSRSEGYLAAPSFQAFYNELTDYYMRPIARLVFPNIYGYDSQTFGFSIEYQAGMDTSLQPHTDASAATLNINMNLPEESYQGSEVDFYDQATGQVKQLRFEPGEAMIHRGNVPHAAQPITQGTRNNMVLWLYGEKMQIPFSNSPFKRLSSEQRWSLPQTQKDSFAPF